MTDTATKKPKSSRNLNFLLVTGLLITIFVLVFAFKNSTRVMVDFVFFNLEVPLAFLIVGSIFAGVILALLFSIPGRWKRKRASDKLKNEVEDLRKELENLSSIK